MLRRAALLIVLLLASAAQSQPVPEQISEVATKAENQADRNASDRGEPSGIPQASAETSKKATDYATENESQQMPMAELLTAILVLVGFGQLLVYGLQARRLRETLVQMRESEERQLRAYVSIERGKLEYPREIGNMTPTATLVFKNFGQTPAYDACIETSLGIFPVPLTRNPPTPEGRKALFTLGPGGVMSVMYAYPTAPTDEEMRQIRAENSAIFVAGRVTYRDAFGKERRTHFRVMQAGRDFGSDRLVACEDGNDAD